MFSKTLNSKCPILPQFQISRSRQNLEMIPKARLKILESWATFIFGDFQVLEKKLEKKVKQGAETCETWGYCCSTETWFQFQSTLLLWSLSLNPSRIGACVYKQSWRATEGEQHLFLELNKLTHEIGRTWMMNIAYQAATVLGVGEHSACFTTVGRHPRLTASRTNGMHLLRQQHRK
jgi:hypothetical protein